MCGCQCSSSPWVWIATIMPGMTSSRPSKRQISAWTHAPGSTPRVCPAAAVEAGVQPQTLGDGQHHLPMGDG